MRRPWAAWPSRAGRREGGEEGIAMVSAILVIFILSIIATTMMAVSMHSLSTVQVDRTSTVSIAAAEAGLDRGVQLLAAAPLPCTETEAALSDTPVLSTWRLAIQYFDANQLPLNTFDGNDNPTSGCAAGTPPTLSSPTNPASALITSLGCALNAGVTTCSATSTLTRTMHSLVQLTVINAGGFDKAIFANNGLTVTNHATVTDATGHNGANVYTNGDFTCSDNETYQGSLYAKGAVSMSQSCTINGDVWAGQTVAASGNGQIGGSAYANGDPTGGGAATTGNITLGETVLGNALARGTVSPCSDVRGTCTSQGNPGDPPQQNFPALDYVPSAWVAAGYATTTLTDCNNLSSAVGGVASQPTVVYIPHGTLHCSSPVSLAKGNYSLGANLVLVAEDGFATSQLTTFSAAAGSVAQYVYLITPAHYLGTTTPVTCSSTTDGTGWISLANQTQFSGLKTLIYTPCSVDMSNNNAAVSGQVYSGASASIGNNFSLAYLPLPVPGGVLSGGATDQATYNVALEYKREG